MNKKNELKKNINMELKETGKKRIKNWISYISRREGR